MLIVLLLALNFLLVGPLTVGVPLLAKLRFPEGAVAYGLIAAGFGGGNLLGSLLAGVIRQAARPGVLLIAVIAGFGIAVWLMSQARSMWLAFLGLRIVGIGNGYLGIIVRTLLH